MNPGEEIYTLDNVTFPENYGSFHNLLSFEKLQELPNIQERIKYATEESIILKEEIKNYKDEIKNLGRNLGYISDLLDGNLKIKEYSNDEDDSEDDSEDDNEDDNEDDSEDEDDSEENDIMSWIYEREEELETYDYYLKNVRLP